MHQNIASVITKNIKKTSEDWMYANRSSVCTLLTERSVDDRTERKVDRWKLPAFAIHFSRIFSVSVFFHFCAVHLIFDLDLRTFLNTSHNPRAIIEK
jgi:hypothetical protein